jgi:MFS family permease
LSGLVDAVPSALARRDVRTIALIGLAHGCSHFFQLVLPPLFPLLVAELGVTYTELGAAMTAFFLASGIGQPLAGLLVDRFGARDVLLLGLGIYVLAVLGMAAASSVPTLICAMLLAGIGNCVFHPADYTLLSASVRSTHLGRAYGVHTLGGNLGWAIAPVFMLSLAGLLGWRAALVSAATLGAMVWLSLWSMRACLRDESDERVAVQPAGPTALTVLLSPAVTLCFGYFALLAAALIAVQNFLPPVLAALYRTPLVLGGRAASWPIGGRRTPWSSPRGSRAPPCSLQPWPTSPFPPPCSSVCCSRLASCQGLRRRRATCWCARPPRRAPPAASSASSIPASTSAPRSHRSPSG